MNREDRIRLHVNSNYIIENLLAENVVDYIFQEGLISNDTREEIAHQITHSSRSKKLLRKLPLDNADCFKIFIQSLRESSQGFIADKLINTDISLYPQLQNDITPIAQENSLEEQQIQLQSFQQQLLDMMNQVNQNVLILHQHQNKETMVDKVDGVIRNSGITNDIAVTYCRDVLREKIRIDQPNAKKEQFDRFACMSESRHIARLLGTDIVKYSLSSSSNIPKPLLEPARVMRVVVDQVTLKYSKIVQENFTEVLQDSHSKGIFEVLQTLAQEIVQDKISWGRIIMLYATAAWAVKYFAANKFPDLNYTIGEFMGYFVSEKLGSWIDENGGWVIIICSFALF